MKSLFQIFVLLALLFSPFGNGQPARAMEQPIVSIAVSSPSIHAGQIAIVTVNMENIPAEGYTSAELTCYYTSDLVEPGDIVIADRFGTDPAVAISYPYPDRFIVAIAGTQGNKATTDGTVFTFDVTGLEPGQAIMGCQTRVSTGNNALTMIESTGANIIILGNVLTPTVDPAFCDRVQFVADITVPDGVSFPPGATFTKTWRLKNIGSCKWTTSYQLVFFSGEQMGAVSFVLFPREVAPGQTVDISVNLIAPSSPGSYRGYWMFKNANGALFGIGAQANKPWWVGIRVSDATATPTGSQTQTPASSTPTSTPGEPTSSPTPSITPGGPAATPIPGVVYDFAATTCAATWFSGAGQLPCPGVDGDPRGFVLRSSNPTLEPGVTDTRPGILTVPQNVQNGYIQGFYPRFQVQNGDRFRSTISCEGGATTCYVVFRLDYQVGSDPIRTFWGPFLERYDGRSYSVDVDLSPLAGQNVRFILTILSAGQASGDRALWVGPIISRANAETTPTSDVSQTPTATPSESPISTYTPTLGPSPTATPISVPTTGTITGQVLAGKPVILDLFDADNNPVAVAFANVDGTFSLTAPAGTYNIVARARGFLSAMGPVTITTGGTTSKPPISLLPGDIDGNFVVDWLDAMTIGFNYNTSFPSEADLNNDGIINVLDLELLAKNYRKIGPVDWQ